MELLTPAIGLVFWTTITFVLLLIVLGKFAWKPILNTVKEREVSIRESLEQAEKARNEMSKLQADNQKLLNEAKEERAKILKEAKEVGERLVSEARDKAGVEYSKKVADASSEIEAQKQAAIAEVKNTAGKLSVDIAEKILRRELADQSAQEAYATTLVNDLKLN